MSELDELIETARILRAPGGCPWDAEQTHDSLVQYLLEETYELIDALETGSRDDVLEELGDVLYQVVFHSDLAQSGSLGEAFDIQDVAKFTKEKMRGRHPHVFGTPEELEKYKAKTGDDVMLNWDNHKQKEKPERESILDGIPPALPALALASKVIGKANKIGLLDEQAQSPIQLENEDQLGALLLAIVQAGKAQGLDAERALRGAVRDLSSDIRKAEVLSASDAGVIGLDSAE
ncbi:MAG: nucleoside triphosphate pyrophosphohydrolase [Micrococcales bacterium]|nr:nucleoside triphosphate pyrophosphohydrolase [Micrococcales bacterium]